MSKKIWRCFHCDTICRTVDEAIAHFGRSDIFEPVCSFETATRIREMEAELERYRADDSDTQRQMYTMQSDHTAELRRAEEDGYNKGVADGRKYPND